MPAEQDQEKRNEESFDHPARFSPHSPRTRTSENVGWIFATLQDYKTNPWQKGPSGVPSQKKGEWEGLMKSFQKQTFS